MKIEEQIINNLSITLGKTKGIINRLKKEVKNQNLNRNECKDILFDLKTNSMVIKHYFIDLMTLYCSRIYMFSDVEKIFNTDICQEVGKIFDIIINKINSLVTYDIDNVQYYNDQKIRNEIYDLTSTLELLIEMNLTKGFSKGIIGLSKINELIGEKLAGLDENWTIAACYLCAIDIAVNKKRKELGLTTDEKTERGKSFDTKFDELIKKLETNKEINKVTKQLPKSFWKIRIDVVHYGYSPNQDELELIIKWSKNIINLIDLNNRRK